MELSQEQLETLDKGQPVSLVVDGRSCVLLSNQTYARVRELIEDWDPSTMKRHMAELMADDWNDPAMNVYDD
ncbi:MAG: hypothetical protein OES79_07725 [Planctomycetota bacterium]|nr:hypothetical protein [Planctomycetota bacterium]